jgi:hypothetical protein
MTDNRIVLNQAEVNTYANRLLTKAYEMCGIMRM